MGIYAENVEELHEVVLMALRIEILKAACKTWVPELPATPSDNQPRRPCRGSALTGTASGRPSKASTRALAAGVTTPKFSTTAVEKKGHAKRACWSKQ